MNGIGNTEEFQQVNIPGAFEFNESMQDTPGFSVATDRGSQAPASNPFETDDMANQSWPSNAQNFNAGSQKSMTRQLIEELESLRKEKLALQENLEVAQGWAVDLDNLLNERQLELQREEHKRVQAERQLQEARKEMRNHKLQTTRTQNDLEQKTRQLTKKLEEKQRSEDTALRQLTQARDHIFRLQPRRTEITETEAQEQFKDLYNSVHRWVTNRLDGILEELDNGQLRDRSFANSAAKRFLGLNSARAMQNTRCHHSDEFVVIAAIMRFLCRAFFNQSFYCPLRKLGGEHDPVMVVDRVETAMRNVPRDPSQCRDWRVEALTALVSDPDFEECRVDHERQKTEELLYAVAPLVPNAEGRELRESIRKNIVCPAMDLAHRLHLAATIFMIRWTQFDEDLQSGIITSARVNLSSFTSMNVALGGKVVETQAETQAMTYLFDVAPGLYSQTLGNQTTPGIKTLYKPRILVTVGEGLPVPPIEGPTLLHWIRSEATREEPGPVDTQKEVRAEGERRSKKKHSTKPDGIRWPFKGGSFRSAG